MGKKMHPGSACDPFDPDGFPVCPEQESGGGEYICDHGGERRGKERLYPLGGIYRPGGSHAESIPPGHGKYPGGCSSELGGTACISRSKIRRGYDEPLSVPLNVEMERGEKLVLTGANGIGKTTLLKSILGLIPVLRGSVELGDYLEIGYFEQETEAPEDLTQSGTGENGNAKTVWLRKYGLKAFSPIAKNFPYSDFDDFGASRSYGFKRKHLGHDMMGQVGTPVIAVESGYVEALGWNQYGGWRIGIRSFDKKRYYYYAHLRQNYPYQSNLKEGSIVTAGDVIGYLGRTGYSTTENTNNITTPHLHFGIQLIFDESQKEGNNEIWVDCYNLTRFLYKNRSAVQKVGESREWKRTLQMTDPAVVKYQKTVKKQ